jgi:hypothetical protein
MANPMREKRTWPPDRDSDGETAAAFEAAVAVVKESVVRSGEVLSSAREDLSDHQRWLKAQAAAVESDRERLARWLQRQRERQEAIERREQARARRRARRQAAIGSVRDAIAGAVFAVRAAVWGSISSIIGGLNAIDATAARGLRWIGASIRDAALYVAAAFRRAALSMGRAFRGIALGTVGALRRAALWLRRAFGGAFHFGFSSVASTLGSVRALFASGVARAGSKLQVVAPAAGHAVTRGFGLIAASTHKASDTIGPRVRENFVWLSGRAENLRRATGEAVAPALSRVAVKTRALAPTLSARMAEARTVVGSHLRDAAHGARGLLATSKTSPEAAENAVSFRQQIGRLDLSQMLIIAGALLLVCGTLMLGGGLLLRAGKPAVAAASTSEPIAWLFEHDTLELDERSVFAFATTPEGVRVRGFAIGGVNMSEQILDAVGAVIKPDREVKDVKLAMRVVAPEEQAGETKIFEPGVPGTIPPQAQFALQFAFPGDGGMTPDQVLSTYGGVMLKVRYEVAGTEKSFIHYLSPSFLERQLAEIMAGSKGS